MSIARQGTTIKEQHITELRSAIDTMRGRVGLSAFAWSIPMLVGKSVRATDIEELRRAVVEAYTAAARPIPSFPDAVLVPGQTVVKREHITEIRTAVWNLE